MEIITTELTGIFIMRPLISIDVRGSFVKTFHAPTIQRAGIKFKPQEEFFSISHKNVIRGMHFQLPPYAQDRLVSCLVGRILDVVVDLRKKSQTYGRVMTYELSAVNREILFISKGFAHGFLSLEEHSLVNYVASCPHAPSEDGGIAWNSFGFSWPVDVPILSERDKKHPALKDFSSPF